MVKNTHVCFLQDEALAPAKYFVYCTLGYLIQDVQFISDKRGLVEGKPTDGVLSLLSLISVGKIQPFFSNEYKYWVTLNLEWCS